MLWLNYNFGTTILHCHLSIISQVYKNFNFYKDFDSFEKLQCGIFPHLQILKIRKTPPRCESLVKFLENNGKYLKEFYVGDNGSNGNKSLNLAIAKFCINIIIIS